MKTIILLAACASAIFSFPAEECTRSKCKPSNNCACSSGGTPLQKGETTPRFVTITFDDSLSDLVYDQFVSRLLFNRTNPDGSPIGATFYVPHKYTNYQKVNDLYNRGFEIAVHSVTKGSVPYFKSASVEVLEQEFGGQREIISKYANILIEDIIGVRVPHFEIAGNTTFTAYQNVGLKYDNSWVLRSGTPLYPFTLDYPPKYNSTAGVPPTHAFPGFWVLPIVSFHTQDRDGFDCNSLRSCALEGTTEELRDWLIKQYQRDHYNGYKYGRTPLTFSLSSSWFLTTDNGMEAFEQFLDYLGTQNDTYLVSHSELLRWSKNPVPLDKYKPEFQKHSRECNREICVLPHGKYENVTMIICSIECPAHYPWVGDV